MENIRLEKENEQREVENLVRESFWNIYRPGCTEHYILHVLRDDKDFVKDLNFVMEKDNKIIGQVAFVKSHVDCDDGIKLPTLTMGPICISPEFARQGYGKKLLDFALSEAKKQGFKGVCIEGNIDFYGNCGFVLANEKNLRYSNMPDEECPFFLCCELENGYFDNISGEYCPPQVYFIDENEAEKYDKQFPYKEKLKLSTQIF